MQGKEGKNYAIMPMNPTPTNPIRTISISPVFQRRWPRRRLFIIVRRLIAHDFSLRPFTAEC